MGSSRAALLLAAGTIVWHVRLVAARLFEALTSSFADLAGAKASFILSFSCLRVTMLRNDLFALSIRRRLPVACSWQKHGVGIHFALP